MRIPTPPHDPCAEKSNRPSIGFFKSVRAVTILNYDLVALRTNVLNTIEHYFAVTLHTACDQNSRHHYDVLAEFSKIKTALGCLEKPDVFNALFFIEDMKHTQLKFISKKDAEKIIQLTFYFIKLGGTRQVLEDSRFTPLNDTNNLSPNSKKARYLSDFKECVAMKYDQRLVGYFLKPHSPSSPIERDFTPPPHR